MDSMKDMRAMLVLWKDKFTVWLSYITAGKIRFTPNLLSANVVQKGAN